MTDKQLKDLIKRIEAFELNEDRGLGKRVPYFNTIDPTTVKAMAEELLAAREILLRLYPFLERSDDSKTTTLVYRLPADAMIYEANQIKERDKIIQAYRDFAAMILNRKNEGEK